MVIVSMVNLSEWPSSVISLARRFTNEALVSTMARCRVQYVQVGLSNHQVVKLCERPQLLLTLIFGQARNVLFLHVDEWALHILLKHLVGSRVLVGK